MNEQKNLEILVLAETGPAEEEGQGGGFSTPTFLEILKSYREKGIFSPPTLSH